MSKLECTNNKNNAVDLSKIRDIISAKRLTDNIPYIRFSNNCEPGIKDEFWWFDNTKERDENFKLGTELLMSIK